MKDGKKKEVSVELAAAAQAAYMEAQRKDQTQQVQKPSNLGLTPGWGGKGR